MYRVIWSTIFIAILVTGCKLSPKPLDGQASSQSVSQEMVCAKEIHIQPVSINGADSPRDAFNFFIKKLQKYTTNNIIVHKTISLTLTPSDINLFIHDYGSDNNIYRLDEADKEKFQKATARLPHNRTTNIMFYTPILHHTPSTQSRSLRGIAFHQRSVQPFNVVAYNKTNIDSAPVITANQAWKIVLTHELGHRLGVPAKATHNKNKHCTSRECIMYSRPDWQSVVSVLALNGMPYDFCDLCKAELIEAKRSCAKEVPALLE